MNVEERFLNYIKFDTSSNPSSKSNPSTLSQFKFAKYLKEELISIGLDDITLDDNSHLMAKLPANTSENDAITIGFISHLDTSPAFNGKNINPQIIKNYDGKDIRLNDNFSIKVEDFPEIKNYIGQDIITTDGNSLLGADDKAGISEIITAIEYLKNNPEIRRPNIKIAFTPDEEIGRGIDNFDLKKFAADFAYTVDAGQIGELQYESFNTCYAKITINYENINTDKYMNALILGIKLNDMLQKNKNSEIKIKHHDFYNICDFSGNEIKCELYYIVRALDKVEFETKKKYLMYCIKRLNSRYNKDIITIKMKDEYYNMKEKIEPVSFIIEKAKIAMEKANVKPLITYVRGGTDGCKLSFRGLPTPNIFTGGHNFHGRYEYIPIKSMRKAVEVIINIAKEFSI